MNEAETRAELIDPKLKSAGWGIVEGSRILSERNVCIITDGRIRIGGGRQKPLIADYILVYKGIKLAVVEAKSSDLGVGEGVMQAKLYAGKLNLDTTYSTNGKEIYQICMKTGQEDLVSNYPTPEELWNKTYPSTSSGQVLVDKWREAFFSIPFEDKSGTWQPWYYQEIAVKNSFSAFPEDAMVRIKPKEIKKTGKVPTNGSIFFTIYDFVDAYRQFSDPERDGKDREMQHMISTSFWGADGKPISAEEFPNNLFGELPNFFKNEEELRVLWSNPATRKTASSFNQ